MDYAKSGTRGAKINLGLVGETFAKLRSGTKVVGVDCTPLAGDTPCFRVIVQADPDNQGKAFVGGRGGCDFELSAGDSVTLSINNLNKVYARAGTVQGSATINWLIMS